jgi:aldose sugar dehydrogenase
VSIIKSRLQSHYFLKLIVKVLTLESMLLLGIISFSVNFSFARLDDQSKDQIISRLPSAHKNQHNSVPFISADSRLVVETVFQGIRFPTSMDFLGPDDILVLEKNEGTVKRIVNGTMLPEPLLDVNVATKAERGMLGLAVSKLKNGTTYVFLFYTEASTKDGDDVSEGKQPLGNRLYRYELKNNHLINPKLILDLPADPGPYHNGGKMVVGPGRDLYLIIGDLFASENASLTKNRFIQHPLAKDGTGSILHVPEDAQKTKTGLFAISNGYHKKKLYYARGIRNSFGMDFDPVTGKLWDTENGPTFGDEINLIRKGFNSGWPAVQGIWEPVIKGIFNEVVSGDIVSSNHRHHHDLADAGVTKYSEPEFIWQHPVGPTAIKFLNSSKLGNQYKNDMFVGDFHTGTLYHFNLDKDRTQLSLRSPLDDKLANNAKELGKVTFARGFGGITDMKIGPDGYLYILSLYEGGNDCRIIHKHCIYYGSGERGNIFRVIPAKKTENKEESLSNRKL